jgi:hypothetical protein
MADASLAAHNRRYRNDVVRIGRVAHAEKKAKRNDGKQRDHLSQTAAAARERVRWRSRTLRILTNSLDFRHALRSVLAGDSANHFAKYAIAFTNRFNSAKTGVRIKMRNVQEGIDEARGIFQPVDFSSSGFLS